MSRIFAYCRVSTTDQTTENQIQAIRAAGIEVPDQRVISEQISGGVSALERPAFAALVNHKLEAGDQLVVLKLDRLGRDNIDVQQTIKILMARGVSVRSLDLPAADLASEEGKLLLQMFCAFAEFEKSRIAERTREGLERAKAEGKALGRKAIPNAHKRVQELKAAGLSQSQVIEKTGFSRSTVKRNWNIPMSNMPDSGLRIRWD